MHGSLLLQLLILLVVANGTAVGAAKPLKHFLISQNTDDARKCVELRTVGCVGEQEDKSVEARAQSANSGNRRG
jgi:hypothetical protein